MIDNPINKAFGIIKEIIPALQICEKFILPPYGMILDKNNPSVPTFMVDFIQQNGLRLPYHCVSLSFSAPIASFIKFGQLPSLKRIVLAFEQHEDLPPELNGDSDFAGGAIMTYLMSTVDSKDIGSFSGRWMPPPYIIAIPIVPRSQSVTLSARGICMPCYCFGHTSNSLTLDSKTQDTFLGESYADLGSLIDLCISLQLKGECTDIIKSPERLNKKRLKRKKLPFYEHRILMVSGGTRWGKKESQGTHHLPPRFHKRRAHLRQYKLGKFCWVRETNVGDPSLGIITKEYQIKGG